MYKAGIERYKKALSLKHPDQKKIREKIEDAKQKLGSHE
jgi:hypothetical protein